MRAQEGVGSIDDDDLGRAEEAHGAEAVEHRGERQLADALVVRGALQPVDIRGAVLRQFADEALDELLFEEVGPAGEDRDRGRLVPGLPGKELGAVEAGL